MDETLLSIDDLADRWQRPAQAIYNLRYRKEGPPAIGSGARSGFASRTWRRGSRRASSIPRTAEVVSDSRRTGPRGPGSAVSPRRSTEAKGTTVAQYETWIRLRSVATVAGALVAGEWEPTTEIIDGMGSIVAAASALADGRRARAGVVMAPDVTLRFLAGWLRSLRRDDDANACIAGADAIVELEEYYAGADAVREPAPGLDLFGHIPDKPQGTAA